MAALEIIEQICKERTITLRALAAKTGINEKKLYNIKAGRIKTISAEMAQQINAVYPEYSVLWLLTGDGTPGGVSSVQSVEAKRIAELERELQKANERIDLLLSMLAGSYKAEELEGSRTPENEPETKSRKRGRPRKE